MARFLRGIDIDGDVWTLRLVGPGDFQVINQADSSGNITPVGQPALIDQITLAGPDPSTTRLIGKVTKAANGDGRVFFANLTELGGTTSSTSSNSLTSFAGFAAQDPANLGPHAIDMPGFWLGQTSTSATAADPTIDIRDGVNTLRFGGVDVTYTPPGGTPLSQQSANHTFTINIGVPKTQGVSIIVDRMVSDAHANPTTPTSTFQNSIVVTVRGRLNVFQANSIEGNSAFPSTGLVGGGGTIVISRTDTAASLTGQIGFIRVGNNATNFSVQTDDRIQQTFIGGETDNVFFLAPEIIRNMFFGRGMDSVTVFTGHIETIQANRGAIDTFVTTRRGIRQITMGGDVVTSTFQSGYHMELDQDFSNQTLPSAENAQEGGLIGHVLIAGDVVDSVFAAGVEPFGGDFSSPLAVQVRGGYIHAKIEGTINNSNIQPDAPGTAFFAKTVNVSRGPVIPPRVSTSPYAYPGRSPSGPRVVQHLQRTKPLPRHNRKAK
jgi:hypothetical protein